MVLGKYFGVVDYVDVCGVPYEVHLLICGECGGKRYEINMMNYAVD